MSAIQILAGNLQKQTLLCLLDISILADKRVNPPYRTVFHLYKKWRTDHVGSVYGDDVLDNIREFSKTSAADIKVAKMADSFVVAIVSPFMKRVHGCNETEETTEHVIDCEQVRELVKEDNPPSLNEMNDRRNLLQIYNYLKTYIKQRNALQSEETTSEDAESSGTTRSSEKQ